MQNNQVYSALNIDSMDIIGQQLVVSVNWWHKSRWKHSSIFKFAFWIKRIWRKRWSDFHSFASKSPIYMFIKYCNWSSFPFIKAILTWLLYQQTIFYNICTSSWQAFMGKIKLTHIESHMIFFLHGCNKNVKELSLL